MDQNDSIIVLSTDEATLSLLVQVRHGCAPGSLDVTLARKLGQVCPFLAGS